MATNQASSVPTLIEYWENLVRAFDRNSGVLAPALGQRDALAAILAQARDARELQLAYIGLKQRATQDLKLVMTAGAEATRCLRRAVAANMGTSNEILAQFQIPPRRSRKRKAIDPGTPSPGTPPEEPGEPEEPETPPVE
jgi:hypothetical protein